MKPIGKTNDQTKTTEEVQGVANVTLEFPLKDYKVNLEPAERLMALFAFYNQKNIDQGKAWNIWPEWELSLTSMEDDLHFEDPETDTPEILVERQQWFNILQFVYDSKAITVDNYTISVEGLHGHHFSFDMCLEHEVWASPRSLVHHYERIKQGSGEVIGPPWQRNTMKFFASDTIEHSLENYWQCPQYVPDYGGMFSGYPFDNRFCIGKKSDETFPLAMLSLIHLCIDDCEIWRMHFANFLSHTGQSD